MFGSLCLCFVVVIVLFLQKCFPPCNSPAYPGTHFANQASLELTKVHLSLHPKRWPQWPEPTDQNKYFHRSTSDQLCFNLLKSRLSSKGMNISADKSGFPCGCCFVFHDIVPLYNSPRCPRPPSVDQLDFCLQIFAHFCLPSASISH